MAKTLAQLKAEIEALQRQTEEVEGVIARIQEAIHHYGLTVEDLFGTRKGGRRAAAVAAKPAAKGTRKRLARKQAGVIRYRDEAGNAWTGNGKRPRWFLDAIASGKTLEDLAVKGAGTR